MKLDATAYFQCVKDDVNRGYANVFVLYVFYFTSEVDNIYFTSEIKDIFNKKHLNFLFIIYKFP